MMSTLRQMSRGTAFPTRLCVRPKKTQISIIKKICLSVKYHIEPHIIIIIIIIIIIKYFDETKQIAKWRPEARTQEKQKQDHNEPDHRHS